MEIAQCVGMAYDEDYSIDPLTITKLPALLMNLPADPDKKRVWIMEVSYHGRSALVYRVCHMTEIYQQDAIWRSIKMLPPSVMATLINEYMANNKSR
jgi:hypothetical protein